MCQHVKTLWLAVGSEKYVCNVTEHINDNGRSWSIQGQSRSLIFVPIYKVRTQLSSDQ